jgi:hypothetical protein
VITPTTRRASPSTTGTKPQSLRHITIAVFARSSSARAVSTFGFMIELTFIGFLPGSWVWANVT